MGKSRKYGLSAAFLLSVVCFALGSPGLVRAVEAAPIAAPAGSSFRADHLTVSLVPLTGSIEPGGTTQVGLHFLLDQGWHVYWVNAGDAGLPPRIEWELPRGITAEPMQFPAPQRIPVGPLMDYGYNTEVLYPIELHAAPGLKVPSTQQLSAKVHWLVCREVCIPGQASLELPVRLASGRTAAEPAVRDLFESFESRMPKPLPAAAHTRFESTPAGFKLAILNLPAQAPGRLKTAQFFPLEANQIDNPAPQQVSISGRGLEISLKAPGMQTALKQLNGVVRFGDGSSYLIHAGPGSVPIMAAIAPSGSESFGGLSLLRFIGLAFLGGIILNLMPCVFPVLFIKGVALVQASSETRSRLRRHGLAYALGILVSFWVVAAVLIVLRAAGSFLGWGFQFQSPGFLAVIALLLFFVGLSLAGMFEIGLSITGAGSGLAQRGGYLGSFFTGVLAMVVATPCTAPFMGVALGFALAAPAAAAFAVFTALALGLAAPYVLLTLEPAWTRIMPRPGAWMEMVRRLASIPIFATVIWLVWLLAESSGTNSLPAILGGFLLLAVAGWILGHWPAKPRATYSALAVVALAVALPLSALALLPGAASQSGTQAQHNSAAASAGDLWQPYSEAALQKYRSEGKPVFVDFTASWCLSCQVNERVVLDRADVRSRLRTSGVVLLRADWTRRNASIARALHKLGRSGVPVYALYLPGQPVHLLPEVLTPGIIFGALQPIEADLRN